MVYQDHQSHKYVCFCFSLFFLREYLQELFLCLFALNPINNGSIFLFSQAIQAKKASEQEIYSDIAKNVVDVEINDIIFSDYDDVTKANPIYMPYPTVDDDPGMSFIYDTSSAFADDSPFDFLDGSMTTNYSRMGPLEGFGSVENLSLDDFY